MRCIECNLKFVGIVFKWSEPCRNEADCNDRMRAIRSANDYECHVDGECIPVEYDGCTKLHTYCPESGFLCKKKWPNF